MTGADDPMGKYVEGMTPELQDVFRKWGDCIAERDTLRAEVDRLRRQPMTSRLKNARRAKHESDKQIADLRTEVERLQVELAKYEAASNIVGLPEGSAVSSTEPTCICKRFRDTGGYRIADLTCPIHGVEGTDPGDGPWEGP